MDDMDHPSRAWVAGSDLCRCEPSLGRRASSDTGPVPGRAVVSYPGRGDSALNSALDLTLTYNSRIWQKVPTATGRERMVYDIDNDWPAPGWRFPFERVVVTKEEPVLVGVDGARYPARVTAADNRSGPETGCGVPFQHTTRLAATCFLDLRTGAGECRSRCPARRSHCGCPRCPVTGPCGSLMACAGRAPQSRKRLKRGLPSSK